MGGVVSIAGALFGAFWMYIVISNGGGLFGLFGLIFVFIGICNAVMNFKNATGKNRYSEYDITDEGEEPDPLNERFGNPYGGGYSASSPDNVFCPYCGNKVENDFEYCNKCGRRLPD